MSGSRARVLIVDDDDALADLIVLWLEADFDVAKVGDGLAALDAMRAARPDVAVVDVMMPRLSGIELAEKLGADPELSHVPLLFMSAYHAILEPHEREIIKPWGLLSKPFAREVLVNRLTEILAATS